MTDNKQVNNDSSIARDDGSSHHVDTNHVKPIVFFDMDCTLADFNKYADELRASGLITGEERPDCWPGIFAHLDPVPGAVDAVDALKDDYELYIASTNPWDNDEGAREKLWWVKSWFGGSGPENPFYKHVIFTHHKELLRGDYLIDDWPAHGASEFKGELIRFGFEPYPDWPTVTRYLLGKTGRFES
jgi:hypothetical protein